MRACRRASSSAGINIAASMAMMAMTTSNSISVKSLELRLRIVMVNPFLTGLSFYPKKIINTWISYLESASDNQPAGGAVLSRSSRATGNCMVSSSVRVPSSI